MCAAARESDKGPGEAGNEAGGEAGRRAGRVPRLSCGQEPPAPHHARLLHFEGKNKNEFQRKTRRERFPGSPTCSLLQENPGMWASSPPESSACPCLCPGLLHLTLTLVLQGSSLFLWLAQEVITYQVWLF